MKADELLIVFSAACAGDQQSWQRLFDYTFALIRYWASNAGYPVAYCQVVDVEDIRIDAWVKFWRYGRFAQFQSGAQMLAYLHGCVRSAVCDEQRRQKKRPMYCDLTPDLRHYDNTLDRVFTGEWINAHFSGIERSFVEDALNGIPPRDTAGRLRMPIHRIYKVRVRLRKVLADGNSVE